MTLRGAVIRTAATFLLAAGMLGAGGEAGALENAAVSIRALGGAPPLLEILLRDPDRSVSSVVLLSGDAHLLRRIPDREESTYAFPVSPFLEAGIHDLEILLRSRDEPGTDVLSARHPFRVSFVDYRWGRDNFSFANDARYRGEVVSYSEILYPWLDTRFEEVSEEDRAFLLLRAYEILRGELGYCYAFSGTAVLYHRYPELLPRFSDTIYAIREANRVVRDSMSLLQNDIVFQRFVTEGVERKPQTPDEAAAQLAVVRAGIDRGEPVVAGILAPERHHSMAVYGYIEDLRGGGVTLLAANNWDREEQDNYSNASVENVLVMPEEPPLRWPGARHEPYRSPTHLVAVEVQKEYTHDRAVLDALIAEIRREEAHRNRRTIIIEGVQRLRFVDVPDHGEEDPPQITRINSNMIVDLPRMGRWELEATALEEDGRYRSARIYTLEAGQVEFRTVELEEPRTRLVIPQDE